MMAAKREKGNWCPTNFFSLSSWNDILQMERNHDRRFPIGVNHPELKNSGARLSHSRSGLGYLKSREREREREDRSLYGIGSRSPVSRKRERHRKKLARVEWYAAAIVPRETVPHIIQLYFYWKMKKEGGRRQAGFTWQETFASLTKGLRAHYFMPYLVSWFTSCHGD